MSRFIWAAAGVAAVIAGSGIAQAAEGISPLQPGATTGNPAGALPPPGLYFSWDTAYEFGKLKDDSGSDQTSPKLKASNVSTVGVLLWVPGWKLFGADYGAMLAQPLKYAHTTVFDEATGASGMVNTSISPLNLSWNLGNGLFVGTGVAVIVPDATTDYTWTGTRWRTTTKNIGNNYWTVEPNLAVTYMTGDWTLTLNNILDINSENTRTNYRTGNIYYLDATVARRIGKYTLGVIGNYTQQLEDDEIFGVAQPDTKIQHLKAGVMVGYDFGAFTVTARYLQALHTRNDVGVSFAHLTVGWKLY
ncbi:transporter [Rhodoplanes sp. TEM]|uniref:Transporter n=1 Tax=Rhodoplanes tepidamans TaxID=200616 RepID=A0ABT5J3W9_RHOTP|nr:MULTISPECIES: transporter [Rhodoplanes]MDC7784349.1 transporter [Rhodoplanes tepidamans]MDC7983387.1 transporter [Rhodoplanes sp. TEM]MDQ0354523.1 hypothetical protein [Rhodoplanes tepidamans]